MSRRLVLFDIDGTLVDTAGVGRRAMAQAFREVFDRNPVEDRKNNVRFAGMTDWSIIEALAEVAGVRAEWSGPVMGRLRETYLSGLAEELREPDPRRRVLPGVQELLDHLSGDDDFHLGLLTGNLEAGARTKLEPFDLNRYFPGGGFGSDDRDRREIARVAHRKISSVVGYDFPADDVAVIGDTEHDVDCAKANGFRAIAVESGWIPRETLEASQPDAIFDTLSDTRAVVQAIKSPRSTASG